MHFTKEVLYPSMLLTATTRSDFQKEEKCTKNKATSFDIMLAEFRWYVAVLSR